MSGAEARLGGHVAEEDLVLFRLGESERETEVRRHLLRCAVCAGRAEEIATVLRVFSGEAVPEAAFGRNWERVRGQMRPHEGGDVAGAGRRRGWGPSGAGRGWAWGAAAMAMVAMLLVVAGVRLRWGGMGRPQIGEVRRSEQMAGVGEGGMAMQVADGERLLTEVNHAEGPIDEATRAQAHQLLLRNAVYVQEARGHGELGEAAVLEQLGRVLTNIDAAPRTGSTGLELRLEWNTAGLLFDLRVLQQGRAKRDWDAKEEER